MDKDQAKTGAAKRDAGATQDGNAAQGGLWQYQVPPQDPGAGAVQSNSAHYTGGAHGGDSRQGDFLASSPEQNAMPAGAPQTSRGSAMGAGGVDTQGGNGPGAGAPGTGRDGMPGASGGGESGGGGSAGGGQPAPVGNGTPDQPVWAT